jgi:hypothetical protein
MKARLSALYLYPIKGCRGIALKSATLAVTGLEDDGIGDREWVVVDADGEFLSQRELPRMTLIETRLGFESLRLRAPGMLPLEVPLASEGDVLQVRVWNDTVAAVTQGDVADAWFSAFLGRPARLMRFDPEGRRLANRRFTRDADVPYKFADAFPLLVTTQASLDDVNERLRRQGQAAIGHDRFRPNVVLEGLDDMGAFDEDYAREFRRNGVVLFAAKPCARCTVPGVDPATGEASDVVPDLLATYRQRQVGDVGGVMFGVNAIVTAGAGATLAVGDEFDVELDL